MCSLRYELMFPRNGVNAPGRPFQRRAPRSARPWVRERKLVVQVVVIVAILGALMTRVVLGGQGNTGTWVTVHPGQSLWGIAAAHYTQTDPRTAIVEIQDANHLHGDLVYPGQRLLLPSD